MVSAPRFARYRRRYPSDFRVDPRPGTPSDDYSSVRPGHNRHGERPVHGTDQHLADLGRPLRPRADHDTRRRRSSLGRGAAAMIQFPRRSVTRFFIPLIDVLTLLFCIFMLMPMIKETGEAQESINSSSADLTLGEEGRQSPNAAASTKEGRSESAN